MKRTLRIPKSSGLMKFLSTLVAAVTLLSPTGLLAGNLPSGHRVIRGSVSVSTNGNNMLVNQTSRSAIVNWQDFSIGEGYGVNISQPSASAAMLARVVGNDPSNIFGSLNANGHLYLVNPNGILFGQNAIVNVNALIASTLDISNENFLNGKLLFEGDSKASVINYGTINADAAALIANNVVNAGAINAKQVGLLGTSSVELGNFNGGKLSVDFSGLAAENKPETLVINQGEVNAVDGDAILFADAGVADNSEGTLIADTAEISGKSVNLASLGNLSVSTLLIDPEGLLTIGDAVMDFDNTPIDSGMSTGALQTALAGVQHLILNYDNFVIEETTINAGDHSLTLATNNYTDANDININGTFTFNGTGDLNLVANTINANDAIVSDSANIKLQAVNGSINDADIITTGNITLTATNEVNVSQISAAAGTVGTVLVNANSVFFAQGFDAADLVINATENVTLSGEVNLNGTDDGLGNIVGGDLVVNAGSFNAIDDGATASSISTYGSQTYNIAGTADFQGNVTAGGVFVGPEFVYEFGNFIINADAINVDGFIDVYGGSVVATANKGIRVGDGIFADGNIYVKAGDALEVIGEVWNYDGYIELLAKSVTIGNETTASDVWSDLGDVQIVATDGILITGDLCAEEGIINIKAGEASEIFGDVRAGEKFDFNAAEIIRFHGEIEAGSVVGVAPVAVFYDDVTATDGNIALQNVDNIQLHATHVPDELVGPEGRVFQEITFASNAAEDSTVALGKVSYDTLPGSQYLTGLVAEAENVALFGNIEAGKVTINGNAILMDNINITAYDPEYSDRPYGTTVEQRQFDLNPRYVKSVTFNGDIDGQYALNVIANEIEFLGDVNVASLDATAYTMYHELAGVGPMGGTITLGSVTAQSIELAADDSVTIDAGDNAFVNAFIDAPLIDITAGDIQIDVTDAAIILNDTEGSVQVNANSVDFIQGFDAANLVINATENVTLSGKVNLTGTDDGLGNIVGGDLVVNAGSFNAIDDGADTSTIIANGSQTYNITGAADFQGIVIAQDGDVVINADSIGGEAHIAANGSIAVVADKGANLGILAAIKNIYVNVGDALVINGTPYGTDIIGLAAGDGYIELLAKSVFIDGDIRTNKGDVQIVATDDATVTGNFIVGYTYPSSDVANISVKAGETFEVGGNLWNYNGGIAIDAGFIEIGTAANTPDYTVSATDSIRLNAEYGLNIYSRSEAGGTHYAVGTYGDIFISALTADFDGMVIAYGGVDFNVGESVRFQDELNAMDSITGVAPVAVFYNNVTSMNGNIALQNVDDIQLHATHVPDELVGPEGRVFQEITFASYAAEDGTVALGNVSYDPLPGSQYLTGLVAEAENVALFGNIEAGKVTINGNAILMNDVSIVAYDPEYSERPYGTTVEQRQFDLNPRAAKSVTFNGDIDGQYTLDIIANEVLFQGDVNVASLGATAYTMANEAAGVEPMGGTVTFGSDAASVAVAAENINLAADESVTVYAGENAFENATIEAPTIEITAGNIQIATIDANDVSLTSTAAESAISIANTAASLESNFTLNISGQDDTAVSVDANNNVAIFMDTVGSTVVKANSVDFLKGFTAADLAVYATENVTLAGAVNVVGIYDAVEDNIVGGDLLVMARSFTTINDGAEESSITTYGKQKYYISGEVNFEGDIAVGDGSTPGDLIINAESFNIDGDLVITDGSIVIVTDREAQFGGNVSATENIYVNAGDAVTIAGGVSNSGDYIELLAKCVTIGDGIAAANDLQIAVTDVATVTGDITAGGNVNVKAGETFEVSGGVTAGALAIDAGFIAIGGPETAVAVNAANGLRLNAEYEMDINGDITVDAGDAFISALSADIDGDITVADGGLDFNALESIKFQGAITANSVAGVAPVAVFYGDVTATAGNIALQNVDNIQLHARHIPDEFVGPEGRDFQVITFKSEAEDGVVGLGSVGYDTEPGSQYVAALVADADTIALFGNIEAGKVDFKGDVVLMDNVSINAYDPTFGDYTAEDERVFRLLPTDAKSIIFEGAVDGEYKLSVTANEIAFLGDVSVAQVTGYATVHYNEAYGIGPEAGTITFGSPEASVTVNCGTSLGAQQSVTVYSDASFTGSNITTPLVDITAANIVVSTFNTQVVNLNADGFITVFVNEYGIEDTTELHINGNPESLFVEGNGNIEMYMTNAGTVFTEAYSVGFMQGFTAADIHVNATDEVWFSGAVNLIGTYDAEEDIYVGGELSVLAGSFSAIEDGGEASSITTLGAQTYNIRGDADFNGSLTVGDGSSPADLIINADMLKVDGDIIVTDGSFTAKSNKAASFGAVTAGRNIYVNAGDALSFSGAVTNEGSYIELLAKGVALGAGVASAGDLQIVATDGVVVAGEATADGNINVKAGEGFEVSGGVAATNGGISIDAGYVTIGGTTTAVALRAANGLRLSAELGLDINGDIAISGGDAYISAQAADIDGAIEIADGGLDFNALESIIFKSTVVANQVTGVAPVAVFYGDVTATDGNIALQNVDSIQLHATYIPPEMVGPEGRDFQTVTFKSEAEGGIVALGNVTYDTVPGTLYNTALVADAENIRLYGDIEAGKVEFKGNTTLMNDIAIIAYDPDFSEYDASEESDFNQVPALPKSVVFDGTVDGGYSLSIKANEIIFNDTVDVDTLDVSAYELVNEANGLEAQAGTALFSGAVTADGSVIVTAEEATFGDVVTANDDIIISTVKPLTIAYDMTSTAGDINIDVTEGGLSLEAALTAYDNASLVAYGTISNDGASVTTTTGDITIISLNEDINLPQTALSAGSKGYYLYANNGAILVGTENDEEHGIMTDAINSEFTAANGIALYGNTALIDSVIANLTDNDIVLSGFGAIYDTNVLNGGKDIAITADTIIESSITATDGSIVLNSDGIGDSIVMARAEGQSITFNQLSINGNVLNSEFYADTVSFFGDGLTIGGEGIVKVFGAETVEIGAEDALVGRVNLTNTNENDASYLVYANKQVDLAQIGNGAMEVGITAADQIVNLTSGAGISTGIEELVTAATLNVVANGNVELDTDVELVNAAVTSGDLTITEKDTSTDDGLIAGLISANNVTITAQNGDLKVDRISAIYTATLTTENGDIVDAERMGDEGTYVFDSEDNIWDEDIIDVIAKSIVLSATKSETRAEGGSIISLEISTQNLTATAGGDIDITNVTDGDVNIDELTAGGDIDYTGNGTGETIVENANAENIEILTEGDLAVNGNVIAADELLLASNGDVEVNGNVTGADVAITAGEDADISGTVTGEEVAITAGDDVNVIADEEGAGAVLGKEVAIIAGDDVNIEGGVAATAGDVSIVAGGDVDVDGTLVASDEVEIVADGDVDVDGTVVGSDIIVLADGDVDVDGSFLAGEDVLIAGDDVILDGGVAAGGDVLIDAEDDVTVGGILIAGEDAVIYAGGDLNAIGNIGAGNDVEIDADGEIWQARNSNIKAGNDVSIAVDGDLTQDAGAEITSMNGDVVIDAGGTVTIDRVTAANLVDMFADESIESATDHSRITARVLNINARHGIADDFIYSLSDGVVTGNDINLRTDSYFGDVENGHPFEVDADGKVTVSEVDGAPGFMGTRRHIWAFLRGRSGDGTIKYVGDGKIPGLLYWNGMLWGGPESAMIEIDRNEGAFTFKAQEMAKRYTADSWFDTFLYFPSDRAMIDYIPGSISIEHILNGKGTIDIQGIDETVEPTDCNMSTLGETFTMYDGENWK